MSKPEYSQDKDEKSKDESRKKVLAEAHERFKICVEAEAQSRKDELDDLKFMVGDQWPTDVKQSRINDARPCLTINRIPQFVRQVTNDQRQNRPSIKINSVDDKADKETAKIFQGIIRHIEYNSHADIAYDKAFEQAVQSGLGYWRVVTEYADPTSFQQEIKIKQIRDRFSVYLDPFSQEPDGSDSSYGFIVDDMPRDEFKMLYPNAELSRMGDWESLGTMQPLWFGDKTVRVAEYYYKTFEEAELVLLSDGTAVEKKHLPETLPDDVRVISERKTQIPRIKWCKINGVEILEETDVPGLWIPIIPVIGEEQIVEGRRTICGIIRHAKDPQRMYNYWASAETETIALAPKAPFVGAEGQFEGFEADWKSSNIKNHAFLQYKPKSLNGTPLPPPQRQVYEPAVQAITQARMQSSEDLKATTGIYDASLGNRSNEQSGVAIQRRNLQAQTSNFHFIDNLSRSLRHTGRILLSWIPSVYDTAQTIRVIGDDGEVDHVKINQLFHEDGQEQAHFLDVGRYDVTVDTGPSYQTKRQEAVASMLDLLRSAPQLMGVSGDILVRNMDWPGADEIADRIKKTLPPGLADDKDQTPLPPQVKAQMDQMSQMIQGLSKELQETSEVIRTKKLELDSRERIELLKAQTDLVIEVMKHDAKDGQVAFEHEMGVLNKLLDPLLQPQPEINDAGGESPAMASGNSAQPTGGFSPGQSMGGIP